MAFTGVSEKHIVFTDGDLIKYNLQPSQFLSGFLVELLEREDSGRSVVHTFPHLTIQEFVAALAQFLTPDHGHILKFLTEAHNTTDGKFDVFLRFVAGLSSPGSARALEEFLGPFPHQTTCRVIDWVKQEFKRHSGNTRSEAGKRRLLNTLHYLFESQNRGLTQAALGSVETLSLSGFRLTPIDCAVLSHVIGLCDAINHLDLLGCHILFEGVQRLGPVLHKCRSLWLDDNCLTVACVENLAQALSANRLLTELHLGHNKLGDSGVKLVSEALRNAECKIQKLSLQASGLTDSCTENLACALSEVRSLKVLELGNNSLTDRSVPALCRLMGTCRNLERITTHIADWFGLSGTRSVTDITSYPKRGYRAETDRWGWTDGKDITRQAGYRTGGDTEGMSPMEVDVLTETQRLQNGRKSIQPNEGASATPENKSNFLRDPLVRLLSPTPHTDRTLPLPLQHHTQPGRQKLTCTCFKLENCSSCSQRDLQNIRVSKRSAGDRFAEHLRQVGNGRLGGPGISRDIASALFNMNQVSVKITETSQGYIGV
ncbi:NACHT, LRR and PYD domains-containing protein 3-like [Pristis pectinata]|uniref:NACHT, LRR and PYD domains-containing protein 3-like n=1 Tax=Pristis pectinata TaxID=685728 RepID=UPI00223E3597|nr:NACHT, LRR and PYD domains-containing protein 3-like [Pristis pectinata]